MCECVWYRKYPRKGEGLKVSKSSEDATPYVDHIGTKSPTPTTPEKSAVPCEVPERKAPEVGSAPVSELL